MSSTKQYTVEVGGKTLVFETGRLAQLAGGAVSVRQGDSLVLAAATMSKSPREGIDFFPLTVDYEERMYAGGRIPGSFFRREGRPSEAAILISRLSDRPLRPLFPKDLRNDVQVIVTSLSSDGENPLDMMALTAASAALMISDVPFLGPVGAVRVGYVDGRLVVNPTYSEMERSTLDLRLAGTADAIMMVECGASEVSEQLLVEALDLGHQSLQPLIELQNQLRAEAGKPKSEYPRFLLNPEVQALISARLGPRLAELISAGLDKTGLNAGLEALEAEAQTLIDPASGLDQKEAGQAFQALLKEQVRARVLNEGARIDGRGTQELRRLSAEVSFSPRAHGSGLFSRGETQVLTLATLGSPRDAQKLDGLSPEDEKRYMHHYNFPPYSTGETRPLRGASRREVGHGALAERALLPVIPSEEVFPYTLRLVSEVLSSNGSTSMASVCGSTLALMDAGVPITAPVAGIAMGLVMGEGGRYAVLTDIQGVEDQLGDMDFKVAGTAQGVTALQMDIKIKGLNPQIMAEALEQARAARTRVLEVIQACLPEPRKSLSPYAPRLITFRIPPDKIGVVIGPGGKMIRKLQEEHDVTIDIEDDGTVVIASVDGTNAERVREIIGGMTETPEVGRIYTGKVVRTTDFGAFVELLPGTDGMVHISQLDTGRVERVEDIARVGDELTVMVINIDPEGKVRLSRRAVLEGWTAEEAMEHDRKPSASGRRSGPPRGGPSRGGGQRGPGGRGSYDRGGERRGPSGPRDDRGRGPRRG